jgi:hypothetical protein
MSSVTNNARTGMCRAANGWAYNLHLAFCSNHPGWCSTLSLSLMLQLMVSWPVCLGIKHPSGAYDQIFITDRQLRVWCGHSMTRGRVCRLQLLLALTSALIIGSKSRGTRNHILLSQIQDFPFHHLLWLAELRWRYSNPPPHGITFYTVITFCVILWVWFRCVMMQHM